MKKIIIGVFLILSRNYAPNDGSIEHLVATGMVLIGGVLLIGSGIRAVKRTNAVIRAK